mmetsp:Transcript_13411/g.31509  ORF Transcript_13411/g.31509 Transcript_13411/m.31509 type:complete len:651 (+) Transcript_13411:91-2043(+)|eukprot:CAMPEP_0178381654 /NCGR_PEP_ID=MMETSP0689_2-20121128/6098_1 /TAXON_ID=160604 /ORGANISM="Amphidinium massartii, Strain CS-259" /LENGTH=650 /DNA_ID=CAMNT_0020001851 /DNA_START=72 /DNA_END=2024 /DNA_ORIENTATION=-
MIYYNSHNWWSLCRFHGSVFPRAFKLALPSTIAAFVVSMFVQHEALDMSYFAMVQESNSVYSGFTFVLGFSLVFRTAECYHRFWTAATSCHEMGSEWSDCAGSLIAFAQTSKRPMGEIQKFTHTAVRLFCLLHAMALEEVADLKDYHCHLIDIAGFDQRDLRILLSEEVQTKRVQVVLCWIKLFIIQNIESGLLNVPAPILTRVFQELGAGLVEYHKAQQVVIWPFPFPYTQMNLVLVYVYMIMTPLVISAWGFAPLTCAVATLVSCVCMIGLDLIASELENPFGDDDNDLPILDIHKQFMRVLLAQLNKKTWRVPRLLPSAVFDHHSLVQQAKILHSPDEKESCTAKVKKCSRYMAGTKDRLATQLKFARNLTEDENRREISRFGNFLKLPFRDREFWARPSIDMTEPEDEPKDSDLRADCNVIYESNNGKEPTVEQHPGSEQTQGSTMHGGSLSPHTLQQAPSAGNLGYINARSFLSSSGSAAGKGLDFREHKAADLGKSEVLAERNWQSSACRSGVWLRSMSLQPGSQLLEYGSDGSNGSPAVRAPAAPDGLFDTFTQQMKGVMDAHFHRLEAIMERQVSTITRVESELRGPQITGPTFSYRSRKPDLPDMGPAKSSGCGGSSSLGRGGSFSPSRGVHFTEAPGNAV